MKRRIEWLDFGKGFFIFLVVIAHVLDGVQGKKIYNNVVNSNIHIISDFLFFFVMPIFFAMSGYLFKRQTTLREYLIFVRKKAINLLTPYIAFSIIYVMLQQVGGDDLAYKHAVSSLLLIWYKPVGYLWFLYVLFFVYVLVGLLSYLKIKYQYQLLIYTLGYILTLKFQINLIIFQTFGDAIFFVVGIFVKKYISSLELKKNTVFWITFIITIISFVISIYSLGINYYFNNLGLDSKNGLTLLIIIPKIISCVACFSFCLCIKETTYFFKYFQKYGKNSLIIYLVHLPVVAIIGDIVLKISVPPVSILILAMFLGAWIVSLIAVVFSNKFSIIRFIFSPINTYKEWREKLS